ncbi:MAG: colanic acid biosynthesis glycosyltransferase WcaL [Verrucomicrobia bacterium]|nr:MAG: colanic acid biosynthesis glycosyltransferase WcaL [Verrucomicrobiota bacterium]PYJ99054.1 MAG: colanic acid biosynthesis glycosyltransferase WcaL [Verrucomicrobiota bacterium]PYL71358.1 MAG: colanic acid biosynthesis glycosyltransferase WcaL [Verrucomicrobiota bacterium]
MAKRVIASYCSSFLKPEMLHIYRQVKALRRVETFVMTKELQNAERFPFRDIEIIPTQRMNLLRHGWLKFVKRRPPVIYRGEYQLLASLLERRGADLMHIYFGHTGVHLLPFIEQWDKPCVVSFHGADVAVKEDIAHYPAKLRRLFEVVPLVFARSQSLADRLSEFGCPPEKLRINRTGVPLDEFPFVDRQAPTDGHWRVMQACRLIPKKGVATSLRAFAIFKKDHPQAKFYIAGKGPLQPELEMLAAGLGIFKDVHFVGFLSQSKLMELYASSHLFLHPSEMPPDENQEGVPNSILEAMATGLPVAATQHGGIPEAVEHGRTGWLVPEEDHIALANAMQEIARSPRVLTEMGLRAREAVIKRFAQEAQIDQLEWFYEEAIVLNGAAEPAESKAITSLAPQFAEQVPAK